MSIIENSIAKFGVSQPIFVATSNLQKLEWKVKDQYKVKIKQYTDPVDLLTAAAYYERFDKSTKKFTLQMEAGTIFGRIMSSIKEGYAKLSPLKNPEQSRTYQFLDNIGYNNVSAEGFIHLFRYMKSFIDQSGNENPHAQNFLAIIEMIREKHED